MNQQQIIDGCLEHTLYTWAATGKVKPMPIARAEGIYLYDYEGKRTLDFNSQLMSVNIGHGHPRVIKAIQEQAAKLCYAFPGSATDVRAELSGKLAKLVPGDINTFFFTLGGAEANENAIKAVRQYTGKFKILSRYRSYHGATNACMQLTGDPRRLPNEPGAPGFVKVMDPTPYQYSFGDSDEEIVANNLRYLDEVIWYEGADNIAAMFIETVTGTNGILPPPKGYLQGLRQLLDDHGILLVCDEVMCGWGRTGKLFGFEHGDIVPDIVTMAKGLTSSYVPLGCMGVSDPIAQHFRDNVFWGGLTYNSHALALGTAITCIDVLLEEGMVENAASLESVMRQEMQGLKDRHASVKDFRCIGLFGMVDTHLWKYNQTHPAMVKFNAALREKGLFTFCRWGSFMCNPPLCITEEQLREAFAIVDSCLHILDAEV
jgi:taurine---2-oxoglutarate transaminase